jgi:hypothetical protein
MLEYASKYMPSQYKRAGVSFFENCNGNMLMNPDFQPRGRRRK